MAVRATGGAVHEGQHVSYAIEVRNGTDHALPDAVVTQQLPANLAFVTASPTARREGHRLTWTLALPAHGIARISMTGAAGRPHHWGSRPVGDQAVAHGGRHGQIATTVCVRADADTGILACATGRSALRANRMPRWQRSAAAFGLLVAVVGGALAGARIWWRRRARRVVPT
ncbi:hypothetical protein GCM10009839_18660 [Catenulispora yoronensis]|uniref:DUF11 domain-containing protein n=1 Tax=Catenulispora yoronensis TaxID=450799 RepID=A0ABP5FEN1_9ACTN